MSGPQIRPGCFGEEIHLLVLVGPVPSVDTILTELFLPPPRPPPAMFTVGGQSPGILSLGPPFKGLLYRSPDMSHEQ